MNGNPLGPGGRCLLRRSWAVLISVGRGHWDANFREYLQHIRNSAKINCSEQQEWHSDNNSEQLSRCGGEAVAKKEIHGR